MKTRITSKVKIECIKTSAGFIPANDIEQDKLIKFKNGGLYTVEVKRSRNPMFHRKAFAFFNYCFEYWKSDKEFMDEAGQFDVFRKHLVCLSGYYDSYYNLKGETRIEAKSLSYGNMEQDEFESCYHALVNAAMKHIFQGCDESMYDDLMRFF